MSMVLVGIDPHKSTLTAVAVNEAGRELAQRTVDNRDDGFLSLLGWAVGLGARVRYAVEDGRPVATRLVRALLAAGASVVWVPPKLMAQARASARTRGKSDPIDALAVARAALREDLPEARLDEQALDLRLVTDRRDQLVAERTAVINRLRWHLVALDPDAEPARGGLRTPSAMARLRDRLQAMPAGVRRELALELLADIERLGERIRVLETQISELVGPLAPTLLAIVGVGPVTAAKILGETAGVGRFRSSAAFAMHNGSAPIPVWSGNTAYRLNRGGNRQLNACLHRIAITQLRRHQPARDLVDAYARRKPSATGKAALRALKRHLSDVVYRAMKADNTDTRLSLPAAA